MQNFRNQLSRSSCLSNLSPRAQRMLEFAKWGRDPDDYKSIIEMLESIGIEPTESLVQLQICYGSLDYHTRYYKAVGSEFDLKAGFADSDENNKYLVDALYHNSAQLHFAVDINGRIYIETRRKIGDPLFWEPFATSFSQLIEGNAVLDEMSEIWSDPILVSFSYCEISPTELEKFLHSFDPTFSQIKEASDENIMWWINDSIRIDYSKAWLGYPNPNKYRFTAYGRSLEILRAFGHYLMNVGMIPRQELHFYSHNKRLYYGYP